ncbi:MAG: beta-galactosidase [Pseudomonadota bacterium]|nr:beta-galactosidase [Pseudomonadota bacterium]
MHLGVCYYPEHWPREKWPDDATRMRELGITWVRIGEFAWSRIEPEPGRYDWAWLDEAVDVLGGTKLKIVMGTPTATPPKWLVDRHPDMLAVGADGRPRGFGSRRHYCFASPAYLKECQRIVTQLARRYGRHPAVAAWQTDNEYGCHDTILSYSPADVQAFRHWLRERHGSIEALNAAWGTVFWSQEYRRFEEVDPPVGTVTEANPAHRLDYRRYASDAVVKFNRAQVELLRRYSPDVPILHNYMGFFTGFDHYAVGRDLDIAGWDSYPLGFLDQGWFSEEEKRRWLRAGHPDIAGFHHDLYRGVGKGRLWVMEQQPGPVNWAAHNPAPLPGMVRLWTWEAFAHGAEVVSYFRWRQAPFAQEQMHTGLNLPDATPDVATAEVRQVHQELARLAPGEAQQADIALVFDYEARWILDIQPQGAGFDYLRLVFDWYESLRQLGVDLDIIPPHAPLSGYRAVVIPSLPVMAEAFIHQLDAFDGPVLIGPRSGSKTAAYHIPANLPPGPLQRLLPLRVTRVESLRPGIAEAVDYAGKQFAVSRWREFVESRLVPLARFADGGGALYESHRRRYLAGWPEAELRRALLADLCREAGVSTVKLPLGLRLRRRGNVQFAFNYGPDTVSVPAAANTPFLLGAARIGPGDLAAWPAG